MVNLFYILIYNFFIRVYYVLIYFASGWNSKAKKWIDGRKNIQLSFEKKQHDKQTIWFHCASVGEYEQALPLQKLVKKRAMAVAAKIPTIPYCKPKK